MTSNNHNNDPWLPCEDGKLRRVSDFVNGSKADQDRRQFIRSASVVGLAAIGIGLGYAFLGQGPSFGNRQMIACSNVQLHLAAFIDGSIDEETRLKIEKHLNHCIDCKKKWYTLQGIDPSLHLPGKRCSDESAKS